MVDAKPSTRIKKRAKQSRKEKEAGVQLKDVKDQLEDDEDSEYSSDSEEDDEEYEVEEILDEKDGEVLVKWVGFDEETWEPTGNIPKMYYNRFCKKEKVAKKHEAEDTTASNQPLCVVCNKEEQGGRYCSTCNKPVHHMCSNEIICELGVEDVLDVCYCSKQCYWVQHAVTSSQAAHTTFAEQKRIQKSQGSKPRKSTTAAKKLFATNENKTERSMEDNTKSTEAANTKPAKKSVNPKKTPKSQSVITSQPSIPSDVAGTDVVGRSVAFSPNSEPWMKPKLYSEVGSLYLVGQVTRQCKNGNGRAIDDQYQIRWTISQFQTNNHLHVLTYDKVCEGILNYEQMMGTRMQTQSWTKLCKPYEEETETGDIWDDFEEIEDSFVRFETDLPLPTDLEEVEKMKSMDFRPDAFLSAPDDLFCHSDGSIETRLREEHKHLFEHSASSAFFAFLPLAFWRKIVDITNQCAANQKQPAVTLEELMRFLGILFFMGTVDKGENANYWGEQVENRMYGEMSSGLDRIMTFKRFKHIRQNLAFRRDFSARELSCDPAARVRPLINILKLRAPTYVELGRNVAVDESSIACRSKYCRNMIVYNATKPTGKYHFKLYLCCCSTTWYAINFKLHCASQIDERLAGVVDTSTIQTLKAATKKSSDVRKHVIEVTLPIHNSHRIVNTDNFYTSCQLLEALKIVGLYCRGTIRENSKFGPKCFMMSKTDNVPRGTLRQGVETKHKIIGASWADGAKVNILSNADDSGTTTVSRMVNRSKVMFTAPTCVANYNACMQGVDRIDQLRARFSIADGHTYKKWHKKLAMAYIDIARCNAYIARKMSGAVLNARDAHRQFVNELSSELIFGDWKNAPGDTGLLYADPAPDGAPQNSVPSPRVPSPSRNSVVCTLKNSKQVFPSSRAKRECVVCRFEGRYPSEQTVYCFQHKVSLCTSAYTSPGPSTYLCPSTDATCWSKYHTFYFPAGLYNANGNIRRSCALFKARKDAELTSRVPQTIPDDNEMIEDSNEDPEAEHEEHEEPLELSVESPSSQSISSREDSLLGQEMRYFSTDNSFGDEDSSVDFGQSHVSHTTPPRPQSLHTRDGDMSTDEVSQPEKQTVEKEWIV